VSNFAIGDPFFSDDSALYTPAYSGGSWLAGLPLTNLKDRRLHLVARSNNALAASTTFDVDLGRTCNVGMLPILVRNRTKSTVPTVQWKVSTVSNFASVVYDSGAVQLWPTGVTADDVTQKDGSEMHVWSVVVPSAVQAGRYVRCAIVDTANTDGYVDVARAPVCGIWRPPQNMNDGARTQFVDPSIKRPTDGGARLYQSKRKARSDAFALNYVTEAVALDTVHAMQLRLGTSGQLFWVFDETDTRMWRRAYCGVLKELNALEYTTGSFMSVGFGIDEDL